MLRIDDFFEKKISVPLEAEEKKEQFRNSNFSINMQDF